MAKMKIRIPCCDSVRSCRQKAIYIQDKITGEIEAIIEAIRCYKLGYTPEITIEFDENKHLVYYLYVTNRRNPHIVFYNIPAFLTETEARKIVLETHFLTR